MNSIEFDEEHPIEKEELINQLFRNEYDPRSNNYKRVLVRPKIKWFLVICFLAILLTLAVLLPILLAHAGLKPVLVLAITLCAVILFLALSAKQIVIYSVCIYQRFAPDSIRNKCRFEPSCSEYMILAIQKYGLAKGLRKGIDRLKRCNVDGGGYDEP